MKLFNHNHSCDRGMAVIAVITLLSLLFIYISGNARTLHYLGRELKLLEQQQVHRLNASAKTNLLVRTNFPAGTPLKSAEAQPTAPPPI